ncbi:kelch repeat-containing protein, partial [Gemmatimonadota bacterium]
GWNDNGQYYASDLVVFDPVTGNTDWLAWMPTARKSATGVEIDGKFIVVGGDNENGVLQVTEIYDPLTNTWTGGQPSPHGGSWTTVGGVINGKLYRPLWDGGWTDSYTAFDVYSRDSYILTLDSGQTLPSPPNSVNVAISNLADLSGNTTDLSADFIPSTGQSPSIFAYQPTGTRSGDITIPYVISDQENNPVWLLAEYQLPGTSSWTPAAVTGDTTDIPVSSYSGSLVWHSSTDLADTRHRQVKFRLTPRDHPDSWGTPFTTLIDLDNRAPVWVSARGSSGDQSFKVWFNEPVSEDAGADVTRYSLSSGLDVTAAAVYEEWKSPSVQIPTPRSGISLVPLDGKLYVIGGHDGSFYTGLVEVYDPLTEIWTTAAPCPTAMSSFIAVTMDGKIYVTGGQADGTYNESLLIYDPENNTWETRASPGFANIWDHRAEAINGKIYVIDQHGDQITIYDPRTDTWENTTGGPGHWASTTGVIDGKLYIAGGSDINNGDKMNTLVVFDPETGITTELSPMPTARDWMIGGVLDGRFYVIGGSPDQGGNSFAVEYFDPGTNSWNTGLDTPTLSQYESAVLNGEIYVPVDEGGLITKWNIYSRNTYELTLEAGQTLPFEQLTLQVTGVKDWEGNAASTLSTNFVPNDANENPSISIDAITEEVSGDIPINYHLSDAEGDLIRLIPEYSIDQEATWQRAITSPDTLDISSSAYDGSLTWYSATDLPGQDVQDIRFRLTPADNSVEIGEPGVITFHLDNNLEPSVTITGTTYSSTDTTWTIDYQLSDAESDTLRIIPNFSIDGGGTWNDVTRVTGAITGLGPDVYTGSIIWHVEDDLPGAVMDILFMIDPMDIDYGFPDEVAIRVNVFGVPAVDITTEITSERSDDIIFAFDITDDEGDPVTLLAEYYIPGDAWYPATVTDDRASDSEYSGTITWHTRTDLEGADDNLTFRLTPVDANGGFTDEVTFHLDNNYVPDVTDLSSVSAILRNHSFSYTLTDAEGDMLDLQCLYSTDSGNNWTDMTVSGATDGINAANYSGSFIWEAFDDLGYGEFTDVLVKIVPGDNDQGTESSTMTTTVRNYVGDYSADGSVSSPDFATLISAYVAQDAYHDIGPATGSVPWLTPTGDGVIDFEDLAVFIQMWNWSLGITARAEAAGLLARPSEKISGSSVADHPVQLEERIPDDLWVPDTGVLELDLRASRFPASMVTSVEIDYDAEHLKFLSLEPGPFMGKASGGDQTLLSLKNVDAEAGRLSLLLGRIDPNDPEVSGNGLLAGLQFKKLSREDSAVRVAYELYNRDAEMTTRAVYESEVSLLRVPDNFELLQNYPNPFNGETMIRFKLPSEQRVQLYVYNIRGQRVATIIDERMEAGYHRITWTGRNDDGRQVGSGVYIYLLQAGPHRQSRKLTYIK